MRALLFSPALVASSALITSWHANYVITSGSITGEFWLNSSVKSQDLTSRIDMSPTIIKFVPTESSPLSLCDQFFTTKSLTTKSLTTESLIIASLYSTTKPLRPASPMIRPTFLGSTLLRPTIHDRALTTESFSSKPLTTDPSRPRLHNPCDRVFNSWVSHYQASYDPSLRTSRDGS